MADKTLRTRIQQKRGTTTHWESSALVPLEGEIILYTDLSPMGVKIGDGVHTASELEFVGLTSDGYPVIRKNGSIVIEDTIKNLAINPVSYIEPVQDGEGDPSPDNVQPISGWDTVEAIRTGKNMLPSLIKGVRIESSTGAELSHASYSTTPYIKYDGKATLYISGMPVTLSNFIAFYDANKNFVGRTSGNAVDKRIIRPSDALHNGRKCEEASYIRLCVYATSDSSGTIDDIDSAQIQLEFGETATEYKPYEAQTLTAELPETVYGGSLDWATGELTVTHKITTIGALTVGHSVTGYQNYTLSGFPDALMVGDDVVTAVSDRFKGLTKNTISSTTDNYLWGSTASPTQVRLKCATHDMTAAEFKTNFADTQIVYRLAKPYTIQLIPQQLKSIEGTNCVWSNCGNTEATFNLTPEIIDKNSCKIVKRTGAFTSAHSIEGLAIHPISYMEPMQAGEETPSPDNVRAISGFDKLEVNRTGKNILSCKDLRALPYTANGITFSYAGEGKISISGTATSGTNLSLNAYSAGRRTFLPAGTYTLSGLTSGSGAKITFIVYETQDSTDSLLATDINDTVKTRTFHIDKDAYFGCYFSISNGTTVDAIVSPQLERSQTATEYEPYDGNTLSVEFPETVYGGTYDWTTGILTVDSVMVNLTGNMIASLSANSAGVPIGRIRKTSLSVACADDYANAAICCSHYPVITPSDDFGIRIGDVYIYIYDTRFIDVETTRTIFNNENPQLVYKIAEPYTIQLTPQQLETIDGLNVVWSNSGDIKAIFNLTPQMPNKSAFKSGTAEEWENDSYVPSVGELIIYTDTTPAGVKVGDGIHTATELAFINFVNGYTQYFYCGSSTVVVGEEGNANVITYAEGVEF